MTCGACDMFSMPPTSAVVASPARISRAPLTIASIPEPQRRFTVSAGRSSGTPAFEADVPRAVDGVGRGLHDVADDDVVDRLRLDAGAREERPRGVGAELDRRGLREGAVVVRHRRAHAVDEHEITRSHRYVPS